MSLVNDLAERIVKLNSKEVPQKIMDKAAMHYIDFIIALIYGSCSVEMYDIIKISQKQFINKQPSSLRDRAFHLSMLGNFSNIEDGCRAAAGHPSVVVIPAAITLAQSLPNVSTHDFLTAIISGYEVFCRIAEAMNPSHLKRGFHTTATVGALASAATAAKLLKLDEKRTATALALAAIQGAGLMESFSSHLMIFSSGKS